MTSTDELYVIERNGVPVHFSNGVPVLYTPAYGRRLIWETEEMPCTLAPHEWRRPKLELRKATFAEKQANMKFYEERRKSK